MSLRGGTTKTTDRRELINTFKNKQNINNLVAVQLPLSFRTRRNLLRCLEMSRRFLPAVEMTTLIEINTSE